MHGLRTVVHWHRPPKRVMTWVWILCSFYLFWCSHLLPGIYGHQALSKNKYDEHSQDRIQRFSINNSSSSHTRSENHVLSVQHDQSQFSNEANLSKDINQNQLDSKNDSNHRKVTGQERDAVKTILNNQDDSNSQRRNVHEEASHHERPGDETENEHRSMRENLCNMSTTTQRVNVEFTTSLVDNGEFCFYYD